MKHWAPKHTLMAGLALIVVVNGFVLGGAMWNRSGEPDGTLSLSQRELQRPYWRGNRDSDVLQLRLVWRALGSRSATAVDAYPSYYGAPEWLDGAKMVSLGFKEAEMQRAGDSRRWKRVQSREVLLVLELDGPAYQDSLERVRQHLAREREKLAAKPDDAEFKRRVSGAENLLKQEESEASRLFVIDAGVDAGELRGRYPDRSRHAIVKGRIRPSPDAPGRENKGRGHVETVSNAAIFVPIEYRRQIDLLPDGRGKASPFVARIAFGKRLEPWVSGVAPADAISR